MTLISRGCRDILPRRQLRNVLTLGEDSVQLMCSRFLRINMTTFFDVMSLACCLRLQYRSYLDFTRECFSVLCAGSYSPLPPLSMPFSRFLDSFFKVWALEVSADGSFVLSGGHDRSLRVWRRTDEMVFLEEEREKELEGLFEAELDRDDVAAAGGEGFAPPRKPVGGTEGRELEGLERRNAAGGIVFFSLLFYCLLVLGVLFWMGCFVCKGVDQELQWPGFGICAFREKGCYRPQSFGVRANRFRRELFSKPFICGLGEGGAVFADVGRCVSVACPFAGGLVGNELCKTFVFCCVLSLASCLSVFSHLSTERPTGRRRRRRGNGRGERRADRVRSCDQTLTGVGQGRREADGSLGAGGAGREACAR